MTDTKDEQPKTLELSEDTKPQSCDATVTQSTPEPIVTAKDIASDLVSQWIMVRTRLISISFYFILNVCFISLALFYLHST